MEFTQEKPLWDLWGCWFSTADVILIPPWAWMISQDFFGFIFLCFLNFFLKTFGKCPNTTREWCLHLPHWKGWQQSHNYFPSTDGKMCKLYFNCSSGVAAEPAFPLQPSSILIKSTLLIFKHFPSFSANLQDPLGKLKSRTKYLQEIIFSCSSFHKMSCEMFAFSTISFHLIEKA